MKKFLLALCAVSLVLPTLVNAGSVSSRYDVTFGGFVKYDLGYSAQNSHADPSSAARSSTSDRAVLADDYGNTFATAGETRFNFLVKGPDLWGAKTSAFIEGDFRGVTTGNQYGGFQLRHAFMKMKWQSAELLIGQAWQQWGMPYYGTWMGVGDFVQYLRGIRVPQVALRYFFTREFNAMVGVTSATQWSGKDGIRQSNDGYARSSWPGLQGEVAFHSDRCGKIGSNNLKFGLGAYFGRDTEAYAESPTATTYKDNTINAWITAFRYSIPIVPEKKGNKAMSVLLNGNFFLGQNVAGSKWLNTPSYGAYQRPDNDTAAPTLFGLYTQASWWITNNLWLNGMYGYLKYNASEWARTNSAAARDRLNMSQTYAVNLQWQANQAVKFGIEWMHMFNSFNGRGTGGANSTGTGLASGNGTIDQYRFAAWYYF
ncbi:MAG: hypothetical protein PHC90_00750 [Syntrophorhabdaceae bacterium]|nr:hypothetical protein [Syntrophorhabdaceae bacterium]